ncbi:hypothetical protein MDA_GLEAN10020810 [Myotis davidii]|uniref:Uncharacterized protein n=1 Tax=Myotis davidii TaxID=225400 RepID=L5M1W3_MYODS|nr:hypothetical protein MDA_GLEAN10020810 [Myotis davidii]
MPPPVKWEIAREAQSGRFRAATSTLRSPPPSPTPSLSSFSRLRSRHHEPNLPPVTSDTLSRDCSARGVRPEEGLALLV